MKVLNNADEEDKINLNLPSQIDKIHTTATIRMTVPIVGSSRILWCPVAQSPQCYIHHYFLGYRSCCRKQHSSSQQSRHRGLISKWESLRTRNIRIYLYIYIHHVLTINDNPSLQNHYSVEYAIYFDFFLQLNTRLVLFCFFKIQSTGQKRNTSWNFLMMEEYQGMQLLFTSTWFPSILYLKHFKLILF